MLQRFIIKSSLIATMVVLLFSCKKENFTPISVNTLLQDSTASGTSLDNWLKTNFLTPYNIDVVYHTNSYFHEYDRNVTPPDPTVIQPYLQKILSGYFAPYNKIAGTDFLKLYGFRQFVLWGSTSYDGSKPPVGYAGTASGGIRINLFGLDGYTPSNWGLIKGALNLIHHEYTHILQQTFTMPPDYQQFTAAYYNANWTQTPDDTARKYGFVSNYASQNPIEDMAETNCHLLVSGQPWFDARVKSSSMGATGLRQKENSIVTYYNNIGIDYRALQKEVQLYLKDSAKDATVTFPYWLNQGTPYTSITVNLKDNMYNQYGQSASFATVYKRMQDSIAKQSTFLATGIKLNFTKKDSMTVSVPFTYANGTGSFIGDFDFAMKINTSTGTVQFTKVNNKAGVTYNNGSYFSRAFANTIQAYLTSNIFIGDWLQYKPQYNVPANLFTRTAGFYVQSDPNNYFYGPLAL